jgi:hypothetical protein
MTDWMAGKASAVLDAVRYPWRTPEQEALGSPACRVCSQPTRDLDGRWHCGMCGVFTFREDSRPPCTRCGQPEQWDARRSRFVCLLCVGHESIPWRPVMDDGAYHVTSGLFRGSPEAAR